MRILGLIILLILIIVVGIFWMAILSSSHNVDLIKRLAPGILVSVLIWGFIILLKRKK